MNSSTGADLTSVFSLAFKASCYCCLLCSPFVAAEVDAVPLLATLALGKGAMGPVTEPAEEAKCFVTFCVKAAASAPSTWSMTLWSCMDELGC